MQSQDKHEATPHEEQSNRTAVRTRLMATATTTIGIDTTPIEMDYIPQGNP